MEAFRKILVAIDLSDYSAETMNCAVGLADKLKAELIIANVIHQRDIDAFEKFSAKSGYSLGEFIKHRESDRSERIQNLIEKTGCANLSITKVFRIGVPFLKLIEIVNDEGVDLVVMGPKGRGNLAGVLFGSNAEKMFRHCPVPVLNVRHREGSGRLRDSNK